MSSRQKRRFLPAVDTVTSAGIALLMRSRQKPRFLPAVDAVMSAGIASCDSGQ